MVKCIFGDTLMHLHKSKKNVWAKKESIQKDLIDNKEVIKLIYPFSQWLRSLTCQLNRNYYVLHQFLLVMNKWLWWHILTQINAFHFIYHKTLALRTLFENTSSAWNFWFVHLVIFLIQSTSRQHKCIDAQNSSWAFILCIFMPWQPPEPENCPNFQMTLYQLLASMLMVVPVATLSTLAEISRCSCMQYFVFAGSRSAPHEGKRQRCAATSWKMALIIAVLDFWGAIVSNLTTTTAHSFRWFMWSHWTMLMPPAEQNFIAFVWRETFKRGENN